MNQNPNGDPADPIRAEVRPRAGAPTLGALSWAAGRAGLSYGRFVQGLSYEDQLRIQAEYEAWEAEQRAEVRDRIRSLHVGDEAEPVDPPDEGLLEE